MAMLTTYKKSSRLLKSRQCKFTKKVLLRRAKPMRVSSTYIKLYVPQSLKLIVRHKNTFNEYTVVAYNNSLIFSLALPSNACNLLFDKNTKVLSIKFLLVSSYLKLYFSRLGELLKVPFRLGFTRVKFKGKGYYIYKSVRNTLSPQFGYSHRLYVYSTFSKVKFTSKSSLIFFGLTTNLTRQISLFFKSLRPINLFTGRGIRLSRQVIYSKPGKISSYR